ncbi:MAG: hypothetical protein J6U04_07755 [Salinivirgaceae bacterium]|nr:hypothetical protein [Salinivirgaceae bacterium]
MRRISVFIAIAALAASMCACNSENRAKQRSIDNMSKGIVNFSKINSLLSGPAGPGVKSLYVDSIAKTINHKLGYEQNLLKIYEMLFMVANETAYPWVNSSIDKYMGADSTNVIMADGEERNETRFRLAIAQNLIDGQAQLNLCHSENPLNLSDLSAMSFLALNSFNSFFFCYYFITDNIDYLQFFSKNNEKVNNLMNYADTIMSCPDIPREEAFKMASTLESTAFIITMNTLSFNMLWTNQSEKMDQMAEFFNSYSERAISTYYGTADKSQIEMFEEKEYVEYLDQATAYKVELMNMVITELSKSQNH